MGFIRSSIPKSTLPWHRRLRSDRRSAWQWAVTVALAVLAAGTVRVAVADTEAARRHWGDTVPVLVTSSAVEAGASITSQTSIRRLPLGAVPEGALVTLPPEARARVDLPASTVLTPELLTHPDADLIDRAVVGIARSDSTPRLDSGDVVEVWDAGIARPEAATLNAVVTAVTGSGVEIAVPRSDLDEVVGAVAVGTVVLVVVPGP